MNDHPNATQQLILDAAERLFSERGYAAVKLQDIAKAVEMRHASLYYYAPEGKEQLYVAVMERNFKRHGDGLTSAIIEAGGDFRTQVHAIAVWFATNPPLDLGRIVRSDMPAIGPENATRLNQLALDALRMPITAVLRNGVRTGLIAVPDVDFAAMGLVGLIQSIHNIPSQYTPDQPTLIRHAVASADMLLDGWLKR
jgi:AcrR family transcriptional regulator